MTPREQIERMMDRLSEALERDKITNKEFHDEMRLLRAEYRDALADGKDEFEDDRQSYLDGLDLADALEEDSN